MDDSFGDGGHRYIGFGGAEYGNTLAVDRNGTANTNPYYGTVVVVGFKENAPNNHQMIVARLQSNGDFDNRFYSSRFSS